MKEEEPKEAEVVQAAPKDAASRMKNRKTSQTPAAHGRGESTFTNAMMRAMCQIHPHQVITSLRTTLFLGPRISRNRLTPKQYN